MKYVIYLIMLIALSLIVFNVLKVDWQAPFEGDSTIALIGILASACVIVLMMILLISKAIASKKK